MYRALQEILKMGTSHHQCTQLPISEAQWSPLHTLPLAATPGTHLLADSRAYSGSSSGRKSGRKRINDKGWPECNVIMEEGNYDGVDDKAYMRRCQALMAFLGFIVLFTVFCLIIWGAGRSYKAEVAVKSLSVSNLYIGSGADFTGVPTNMLNVNGSLRISIYNPATFYGIHVSATPVNLIYTDVAVATGQLKKYFQPRKSHRTLFVHIEGTKVPLYGAGSTLIISNNAFKVPLTLEFEIRSRGDVVGKLVVFTMDSDEIIRRVASLKLSSSSIGEPLIIPEELAAAADENLPQIPQSGNRAIIKFKPEGSKRSDDGLVPLLKNKQASVLPDLMEVQGTLSVDELKLTTE
ncbi:hypothetical protein F511_08873 [Dorcoceras hygrometricum]|uniref:Uncharacterized protein n=1 Tax=Dorcoceras hygrometricum TaxID=472368 RepID=A0A2Z7C9Y8_9LAMI|nr:hypothetical protein F511_08873 [Dorcoceras hygrometricum]